MPNRGREFIWPGIALHPTGHNTQGTKVKQKNPSDNHPNDLVLPDIYGIASKCSALPNDGYKAGLGFPFGNNQTVFSGIENLIHKTVYRGIIVNFQGLQNSVPYLLILLCML